MSQAGWYPDPGGEPGMFRYWDGASWSDDVSPTPGQPGDTFRRGAEPSGYVGADGQLHPTAPVTARGADAFRPQYAQATARRKTPVGAILAVVGVVIALGLVITFAVRGASGLALPGAKPAAQQSDDVCPKNNVTVTPRAHPSDGRVHGGLVSFPRLSAPWSAPVADDRVPFGADVHGQTLMVEDNYDHMGSSWVASILVGDLVAGDGFYGPKEGAEIVARCVVGLFYGNNKIDRQDVKSEAHPVQGTDGWLIQMHLTFNIPGLKCKGETATILVLATGASSASLYYSSIPDTTPELVPVAQQALDQLTVDK